VPVRTVSALAALAVAVLASPAGAATYRVTMRTDPAPGACTAGHCSLREAVLAANASLGVADTIVLPKARVYTLTLAGTDDGGMAGDLDITNDPLRIVHTGRGKATIDGAGFDRVFDVFLGGPLTLEKLVVRNGNVAGPNGYGGGIRARAKVTLLRTNVTGNVASGCGGGIHMENGARLVLKNARVTGNRAGSDGGGISASCFGTGGAVTIERSTIASNRGDADSNGTGRGGGIYLQTNDGRLSTITRTTWTRNRTGSEGGGIYTDLGRVRMTSSTVSWNTSGSNGGGIEIDGTNPFVGINLTVSRNRAASVGGGIHADGQAVRLNAVTVVRNVGNSDGLLSEAGGGLFTDVPAGGFRVENSIVALNTLMPLTPGDPPVKNDCSGGEAFTSGGHNLLSTKFLCDGFTKPSDRRRANPKLGTLGLHGGPTATVPLKAGSPALGHAGASAPRLDQRGVRRKNPDIGAYERRSP
jgi:CSLREA domain-containing protein